MVRKTILAERDKAEVSFPAPGRVARVCMKGEGDQGVFRSCLWNVHNFGIDNGQMKKIERDLGNDIAAAKRNPELTHVCAGGDSQLR